jgi:hypothetical protein
MNCRLSAPSGEHFELAETALKDVIARIPTPHAAERALRILQYAFGSSLIRRRQRPRYHSGGLDSR